MEHDFFRWMADSRLAMERDYQSISSRSKEDPGTAGDRAEDNWAEFLRNWLPPTFQVVTKGRILFADGTSSPQVDVIVLKPSYPRGLQKQKYYLVGGVLAAFECKLTLRKADIDKAFETASKIKRNSPKRQGSPYREVFTAPIYGVLAHTSKIGKGKGAVYDKIDECVGKYAEHPNELIDIFCILDDCTVNLQKRILLSQDLNEDAFDGVDEIPDDELLVETFYNMLSETPQTPYSLGRVLASFVNELTGKIAYADVSVRDWAWHITEIGVYFGIGKIALWESDFLTDEVRTVLFSSRERGKKWSEWDEYLP